MNLKEYSKLASRTDAPISPTYDKLHAVHMVMGMVTEVGELQDIYKKNLAYGKPIDEVNEKEEIGDLMWYIANHCRVKGWDLGEILETNIKKLQARFPEKFDPAFAINRDLEAERKILENE
jgi:NTP pyrophosphatase (non-canonical NTP hydrolase)